MDERRGKEGIHVGAFLGAAGSCFLSGEECCVVLCCVVSCRVYRIIS